MNDIKMKKEQAVSPVIGVMMMLVVTIVIAAVVASFAGAITSTEQAAPTTTFDVSYKASVSDTDKTNHEPNYPTNMPKNNGITFKVLSGDSVQLKNIKVILSSEGKSITFTSDTFRAHDDAVNTDLIDMVGDSFFAVPKGMDTTISAGKSFSLIANAYYDNSNEAAANVKGKFLVWDIDNGGSFAAKDFVPITYSVFDTISGKQIQTGSLIIK